MSYRNKEWLNEQYNNQKKSTIEIAKLVGKHQQTITYWMDKHNLPRRNQKEASAKWKGENHPDWKGDDITYSTIHDWVKRNKPKPEFCEICDEPKKLDISNVSGEYKRDVNDFQWVCHSCHLKYDHKRGLNVNPWIQIRELVDALKLRECNKLIEIIKFRIYEITGE